MITIWFFKYRRDAILIHSGKAKELLQHTRNKHISLPVVQLFFCIYNFSDLPVIIPGIFAPVDKSFSISLVINIFLRNRNQIISISVGLKKRQLFLSIRPLTIFLTGQHGIMRFFPFFLYLFNKLQAGFHFQRRNFIKINGKPALSAPCCWDKVFPPETSAHTGANHQTAPLPAVW